MRVWILLCAVIAVLPASNLDSLIKQAFKAHPSLQTIKHRLEAADHRIAKSRLWQNPDVSITINDIQPSDIADRRIEPMQFEAIQVMQRFPWFGKTDAKERIEQARKHRLIATYDEAKTALAREIKRTVYTIKELEARIALVRRYMQIEKQNIDLFNATIATDADSHAKGVTAELSLSKIKVTLARYRAMLDEQRAKLDYLVGHRVKRVDASLRMPRTRSLEYYLSRLSHNPTLRIRQADSTVARRTETLSRLDQTPDPYIKAGYYHRSAFEDYASVSVGVALPVYGNESRDTQIAKAKRLAAQSAVIDTKVRLQSDLRQAYAKLQEARRIHRIIQTESLPHVTHMLELSADALQSGADIFTYTTILEQKLFLEEERIAALAQMQRAKADIDALIGE